MRSASFLVFSDPDRSPLRRRIVAATLTILAHILLLIMLLRLAPYQPKLPGLLNKLITFNVLPEAQSQKQTAKAAAASNAAATHAPAAVQPRAAPPTLFKNAPTPWVLTPGLEKFDIKQVPATQPAEQSTPEADTAEADSAYSGGDGKSAYGPNRDGSAGGGTGERLYYAEWYRRPTDAELSYYLPKDNRQEGWGEVACQTIERYHVDNCRELGESPGTGLARAVRQSAWQFLVRPPHVGGRSLVGAWVRIRITYSERGANIDRSHYH